MRSRKFSRNFQGAVALAIAFSSASAFGESLWIKSSSAIMREGKAAIYKPVTTLPQGTEVTVISREAGWVQASAGASKGWIAEASLSPSKVNGEFKLLPGANAEMGTGIAARGLQPGAEDYVRARGMDKRPLESLIAIRNAIPPSEWIDFIRDVHR